MADPVFQMGIETGADVVAVRQSARDAAAAFGFDAIDQARIATAVSEIARNALVHAGGGGATFHVRQVDGVPAFVIEIADRGKGIDALSAVLAGRKRRNRTGGFGMAGARQLMDDFRVESRPGEGTTVTLEKRLPRAGAAVTPASLARLRARLGGRQSDPMRLLDSQSQELLQGLRELQAREQELVRLNREIEETNRGVVALYAELDDRANQLRQASELKSRFLSNMSHEFRTPLNAIVALSGFLLDEADGPLTPEQAKQIGLMRKSATDLIGMINDLLDLAKVEAGKIELRVATLRVDELFGALRGLFRPLAVGDTVALVFDPAEDLPVLLSDEAKIAQILRNLVSNALKFTERGEVRVAAAREAATGDILFTVRDTGIGIAPADRERIFEEFSQVTHPIQQRVKGTGLGLPLSRQLAELLGGTLTVESTLGEGAEFTLRLPASAAVADPKPAETAAGTRRLLVIDDEPTARYVIRQAVRDTGMELVEAEDGGKGLARARADPPDLIFLDLRMPGIDGYEVLERLQAEPTTRDIPVVVVTASVLDAVDRRRLASARAILEKQEISRDRVRDIVAALCPA